MLSLRVEKQGPSWILVDKPAGFHTHPPEDKQIRVNPRRDALGILTRQLGVPLAPAHRLDRAASGLLLFTRATPARAALHALFAGGEVKKKYFVLVRGEPRGRCELREPLDGAPAVTIAEPCFTFALPLAHPRGGDRGFTVLEVSPESGRFHQIRRHFAQAGFPLMGDTRHGDRRLNREFAALTGLNGLFLRCMTMEFRCPESGETVAARARWSKDWHKLFELAGVCALAKMTCSQVGDAQGNFPGFR